MINYIKTALIALAMTCFGYLASTETAHAQNFVSYVSKSGTDDNNCNSPASACARVTRGIEATNAGGVVIIIGPYSTDVPGVAKSIKIIGQGTVVMYKIDFDNIPDVSIAGVDFVYNPVNAIEGVRIGNATKATFINCSFSGYLSEAIKVNGSAGARVTLENVRMIGNKYGVVVEGVSGAVNAAFIKDSLIDRSTSSAVEVRGAASTVVLNNSTLSGSGGLDLSRVNGGKAISYGNNVIRSGTPTQTLPNY